MGYRTDMGATRHGLAVPRHGHARTSSALRCRVHRQDHERSQIRRQGGQDRRRVVREPGVAMTEARMTPAPRDLGLHLYPAVALAGERVGDAPGAGLELRERVGLVCADARPQPYWQASERATSMTCAGSSMPAASDQSEPRSVQ